MWVNRKQLTRLSPGPGCTLARVLALVDTEPGIDGDDGVVHHMVSTINATEITLYIDGELMASTPLDAHNSIAGISPKYALLAKGGYGADPEWIGSIEEFNIYNVALSADEVQANFTAGLVQ